LHYLRKKLQNKEPLTIVSPGTQKRNFTHVDDIVEGLILIGENGYGDEFGIGCDEAFSVIEVAEMFLGMDIESAIKEKKAYMLPPRRGNRMEAEVVTDKTKVLGWNATHNLIDYINELRNLK